MPHYVVTYTIHDTDTTEKFEAVLVDLKLGKEDDQSSYFGMSDLPVEDFLTALFERVSDLPWQGDDRVTVYLPWNGDIGKFPIKNKGDAGLNNLV